jgi:hypothetical protein
MTLKEFKQEFRLICSDEWGDAMDAWFECAGRMYKKNMEIPDTWEYRPSPPEQCEKDSYFYSLFARSTNKQLQIIGNFLFRYCQRLKFLCKDY